jgi:histidinol-phosphate phosphatase family protein
LSALDAVFLDRDGTLIEDPGYLSDPGAVALRPGAAEAVGWLNEAGIPVIVVTNQSGIGRGYYTEADFRAVQAEVERQLAVHGASLDAVYFCPHDPEVESCDCRKPGTELFERAARDFGISLDRCLYIGDRIRDLIPGQALGGEAILVAGSEGGYDGPVSAELPQRENLLEAIRQAVPRSEP